MAIEPRVEYFVKQLFEELVPGRELSFYQDSSVFTMEEILHMGYTDPKVDSFHIQIEAVLKSSGWALTKEGFDIKTNYRYVEYKRSEFMAVKSQSPKEPELVDNHRLREINF